MPATAVVLADAQVKSILAPISAANTAAATSAGVDLYGYEGVVFVNIDIGAITGSIANLKVQGSTDNTTFNDLLAGGTVLSGNATANTSYGLGIDTRSVRTSAGMCRYIRVIGTVTTGPVLISASLVAFPKVA